MKSNVIAIDGPSGSGKSTIAKALASKLNITYLDTGSMYRGIAYMLDNAGINSQDTKEIKQYLDKMQFEYGVSDDQLIIINGRNLTTTIRNHKVSKLASIYSQIGVVREYLKDVQRNIASKRMSVMEGRDIGTVIFPDALLKIFLTADTSIRAQRRFEELNDSSLSLEKIKEDIEKRDYEDRNRKIAPLKKAEDAVEIDSSGLSIEEIVNQISILYTKLTK